MGKHARNLEQRDELVLQYLPLVHKIALRFAGQDEHDDLIQAGSIGLLRAAEAFDPARGVKFLTFAYRCIFNEILRHMHGRRLIRTRNHDKAAVEKVKAVKFLDLADHDQPGPTGELEQIDRVDELQAVLRHLPPRSQRILREWATGEPTAAIGRRLGISKQRAQQLKQQALAAARKHAARSALAPRRRPA